ncbi:hypothetical protein J4E93_006900 [Alternaria ventricosa]|uniref:uncharacterized protein n=1 Tax=Alternaria ventricosa TaxID=1187951 RepID=UPI0020C430C6|nr:uncharacterized protein J4E93_006900 [Alternaria ventricosa]KAI4642831.1 hypothetical protein J4E93_006900 [Alternaria ventricosa]
MAQLPVPQQLFLQKLINDAGMQLDMELMTGLPVTVEAPLKRWLILIANNASNLSFDAWQGYRHEHAELFFTGFTDQLVASGHLELDESPVPVAAVASIAQPPAPGPSASSVSAIGARTPRQDSHEEEERIKVDESMNREMLETEGDHLSEDDEEEQLEDDEEEQLEDEEEERPEDEEDYLHKRWPTPEFLKGVTVTEAEEREEMRQYHIMSRKLGDY